MTDTETLSGIAQIAASGNLLENRAWIAMPAHSTQHKMLTTAVVGNTMHFENLDPGP
jgi:hypothetical protein